MLSHPPHPKPPRNNSTEYSERKNQEGVHIDVITPPPPTPTPPPETPERDTTIRKICTTTRAVLHPLA